MQLQLSFFIFGLYFAAFDNITLKQPKSQRVVRLGVRSFTLLLDRALVKRLPDLCWSNKEPIKGGCGSMNVDELQAAILSVATGGAKALHSAAVFIFSHALCAMLHRDNAVFLTVFQKTTLHCLVTSSWFVPAAGFGTD